MASNHIKYSFIVAVWGLALLSGCSLDSDKDASVEEHFLVGESLNGSMTTSFEPSRQLCAFGEHYPYLDLNSDGEVDLSFNCNTWQSSGGYRLSESKLIVVNDQFEILAQERVDTIRVCYYFYVLESQDTIWNKCYYNLPVNRCSDWCSDLRADTIAYLESNPIALKFSKYDTLPNDLNWITGEMILGHHNTTGREPSLTADGEGKLYDVVLGQFIDDPSSYLVFRYKILDEYKLGWIHIGNYEITGMWTEGYSIEGEL